MLLKSKYRHMLLDIFSDIPIDVEVWAYGSRVKGDAHEGSDLDLVMVTPDRKSIPFDVLRNLKEKIKKSNIPIIVELFDWARLPLSFRENIEKSHELLFRSELNVVQEPKIGFNQEEHKSKD